MTGAQSTKVQTAQSESITIELRDPPLAAFLAWLVPGLGHFYQGRFAKGVLFMVCILGTFFYGLYLGGSHVVYAAWQPPELRRWHYISQIGVGLPALPALVQAQRMRTGRQPLWGGFMAPPRDIKDLEEWNYQLNSYYDLGTAYTMIAGLLNILVIYDAYAGPIIVLPRKKKRKPRDGPEDVPDDTQGKESKAAKGEKS